MIWRKAMIPVFLISDENYAKYTAVTIKSVLSGTKEKIDFYLLDGGISSESKKIISEIVDTAGSSIEFIPMELSLFKNFPDVAHFSLNMYFRYLIPELKPNLNKALYIDTDMIIGGDILQHFSRRIRTRCRSVYNGRIAYQVLSKIQK